MQRAICAGLIIPTPEVSDMPEMDIHDKLYPANYKQPFQLIHMQRKKFLKQYFLNVYYLKYLNSMLTVDLVYIYSPS